MRVIERTSLPFTYEVVAIGDDDNELGSLYYRTRPGTKTIEGFRVVIPEENQGQGVLTAIVNYLVAKPSLFDPDSTISVSVDGNTVAMGTGAVAVDVDPAVAQALQSIFAAINNTRQS